VVDWKSIGSPMGVVDLRTLNEDQIVIHFGGALTSVDAYTFANSLIAISDSIRALNNNLNPSENIEVRLEAVGPGSFRAVVRKARKGLTGFFARAPENLFWALFATFLLPRFFGHEGSQTIVYDDRVEIHVDGDVVIVPRAAYEKIGAVKKDENVQKSIRKTFEIIENDDAISNFGVTANIEDPVPLVQVDRTEFPALSSPTTALAGDENRRERREKARLTIIKPWLKSGNRKWTFEWNGVPISAPILSASFLKGIENRTYLIGHGDAIDVTLKYEQEYSSSTGLWINDSQSYQIEDVHGFIPRLTDNSLFKDES
jgi:hypothetical protein